MASSRSFDFGHQGEDNLCRLGWMWILIVGSKMTRNDGGSIVSIPTNETFLDEPKPLPEGDLAIVMSFGRIKCRLTLH